MLKNSLPSLPETPGVYLYSDQKKVIYVGKAINLKSRVNSYFNLHLDEKTAKMIGQAINLKFIKVESELEALLLEAKLIKKYMPHYNIISKDDKHPLYIAITKEEFPRVLCVRKLMANSYPLIASFGPFPNSQNVHFVLKMIRRIFPYSDHKIGKKPCLYSHIGLCNPCPNVATKNLIYLKNIKNIKKILDGKIDSLKKDLVKDMNKFSKQQNYEEAGRLRDQIEKLEYITRKRIPADNYLQNPNLYEDQRNKELIELSKLVNIKKLHRIECFDIAHLQGLSATASMVVAINGEMEKSQYRHFKIKQLKRQSDFDSMEEIAKRRLKHFQDWGVPDLIVVDGSIGQINKFKKVIKNVPIVGIAKNPDRLIISAENKVKLQGPSLQLLARLRNEAHRFARRLHHKLIASDFVLK